MRVWSERRTAATPGMNWNLCYPRLQIFLWKIIHRIWYWIIMTYNGIHISVYDLNISKLVLTNIAILKKFQKLDYETLKTLLWYYESFSILLIKTSLVDSLIGPSLFFHFSLFTWYMQNYMLSNDINFRKSHCEIIFYLIPFKYTIMVYWCAQYNRYICTKIIGNNFQSSNI